MAIPSVQVFLGQETTIDAIPTWVDITAYLRLEAGVTRSVGKSYGGGAQPGTASLTLDNTDARFTVGNVSSPYYPYVHLQSLIKILRDGRPFFVGRIQSMPMSWPTGGDDQCIVTMSLADKMARYGRIMLDTFAVEEIMSLSPTAYWPMVESSGATGCGNRVATFGPLILNAPGDGTIAFGSGAGPVGDGRSVAQFTPGTVAASLVSPFAVCDTTVTGAVTVSATFATTVGGIVARFFVVSTMPSSATGWNMDILTGLRLGVPGIWVNDYYGPTAFTDSLFFAVPVLDGAVHIVTVVIGAAGATHPDCYVDGVVVAPTAGLNATTSIAVTSASLQVGSGPTQDTSIPVTGFAGSIGHVALWARAITAAELARMVAALKGATLTTRAAILKVLGWRGQAATALIDAGATDGITSTVLGGGSLGSRLNAINDSEAGTLYVDGQDRLTWKSRRTLLAPMLTLTNDDINAPTFNCEMQGIVTKVTATQLGITTIVTSADIATIGEASGSVTSVSNVDGDGAAHASAVANGAPRGPYIGSLTVDLATAQNAPFAAAVTGGILAGVTLTGMPSQAPPGSTVLEIIGERESFSHQSWDLTWTTQPAGLGSVRDVLILDDATYGVLDSTHRIAY